VNKLQTFCHNSDEIVPFAYIDRFQIIISQILRRRIREGKALLEKSPFLPHKEAVLGDFLSLLNQNRHFLTCFEDVQTSIFRFELSPIG